MLKTPIVLPKIGWSDTESVLHTILKTIEAGSLEVERETVLADDLALLSPATETLNPPAYALACALTAYERYPWHKQNEPPPVHSVVSERFKTYFPGAVK